MRTKEENRILADKIGCHLDFVEAQPNKTDAEIEASYNLIIQGNRYMNEGEDK